MIHARYIPVHQYQKDIQRRMQVERLRVAPTKQWSGVRYVVTIVKVWSQLTRIMYTIKGCVQSCRFKKNEPKTAIVCLIFTHFLCLVPFSYSRQCIKLYYTLYSMKHNFLHDISTMWTRLITGSTQFPNMILGRSTGRLHALLRGLQEPTRKCSQPTRMSRFNRLWFCKKYAFW